ncbi:MAG: glycosyltransferase family 2 protein [Patescibacteria group bacterium]
MILSIIILNYKSEGLVRYCIKNILKSNIGLEYEIIVVDNASPNGGVEKLKIEYPAIRFIELKENNGFSAGNNAGIKAAKGKYISIMNPDIVVSPGSFEKLVDFMDRNSDVGCSGPKLLNPDGTIQNSCLRFPTGIMPLYRRSPLGKSSSGQRYLKHYLMHDFDHNSNIPVDWLFGACIIARKSAIDDVGLLDEKYFLYIGDTDWCRMFWEKGYKVYYVAESKMIHYHHRESAANPGISGVFNYVTRIHLRDFYHYTKKFKNKKLPVKN